MSARQPHPRNRHAAIGIGRKLHIWGGDGGAYKITTSTIHSFDLCSETWGKARQLDCSLPDALCSMAVATDGESAYFFGGATGSGTCFNTLYQINPSTLKCKKLVPGAPSCTPTQKCGSGMVYFNGKLVVHGGHIGHGWTDELHVFDLTTGKHEDCVYCDHCMSRWLATTQFGLAAEGFVGLVGYGEVSFSTNPKPENTCMGVVSGWNTRV